MPWADEAFDTRQQRGFHLLGRTIRRRRTSLGLSQRQLEALSGIDQTVISRLENGKQTGLRWVRLAQLVDALDGLETPQDRPSPAELHAASDRAHPIAPAQPPKPRIIDISLPDVDLGAEADSILVDPNW
jgi:transcriptional regulator with XRE-family HTH domain